MNLFAPRLNRSLLPAALIALAMLAAACGGSDDTTERYSTPDGGADRADTTEVGDTGDAATTEGTAETPTVDSGPRLDPSTFEGEAVTVDGDAFDLAQLANSDLVIWFWAPW